MHKVWRKFAPIIHSYDCFICPTVATTDVPSTFKPFDNMLINNCKADRWVFTLLFNVLRYCPVLAVPSGKANNNVPTGVQVVGKPLDDKMVFQVGSVIEESFGFFKAKGDVPIV